MDLSIIIVNWNSAEYLVDCLASVRAFTRRLEYEVIVVDNASSEKDREILKQHCPNIAVIESPDNLGFARANNLGFTRSSGDYVLFLNPDTQLRNPAINIMMEEIRSLADAGIVGCKLLNTDLSVQLSALQRTPTILNQVLDAEYLQLRWPQLPLWGIAPLFSDNSRPAKADVVSGACMLLRREVFRRVGMFSEDYFMYAEDIDLNYKVARQTLSNYYVGKATIIHHGGRSSAGQIVNQWSTIMKQRSMQQYFRKTRGPLYEWLYRCAMGCAAASRVAMLAFAYPMGRLIGKRESRQRAMRKWLAILKSSIGRQAISLEGN
jgi:N-acetylglucosaminyl-diphospho-decaprenol L-rhamnosyltransferase